MQVVFSQGIAILSSHAPDVETLRHLLEHHGYSISNTDDTAVWPEMKGPSLDIGSGGSGFCQVDVCNFPWPDDMGIRGDSVTMSNAYAHGAFGPYVLPEALDRALKSPASRDVSSKASSHQAFVRVRMCRWVDGSEPTEPTSASATYDVDVMQEISFMLRVAAALTEAPSALAYFNPNGEILMSGEKLKECSIRAQEPEAFPIETICSCRGGLIEETWSWLDCVGLAQLGLRDHEFVWTGSEVSRRTQLEFMLAMIHYQLDERAHITTGHAANGPQGTVWHAEERPNSCMNPRRQVLHWTLEGAPPEPSYFATYAQTGEPAEEGETASAASGLEDQINPWLAYRDTIRTRAAAWLRSPEFRSSYYDDAHLPPTLRAALEKETSRKEAEKTWNQIKYMGEQTTELWNQYQQLGTEGEVWLAVPLMSNPGFQSKPNMMLPCTVLATAEQTAQAITHARDFADLAFAIYSGEASTQKAPVTARMLANDKFRLFGRDSLPLHETQGLHVVLLSVMLKKSWMPPEGTPFVPLLASPGPQGAVIQIPWHVAAGTPALPGSVEPGRFADMPGEGTPGSGQESPKLGSWHIFCMIAALVLIGGLVAAILKVFHIL